MSSQAPRELLSSRLGFLLISAGCAIGLGNVWRFPFITGQYGGAIFVAFYVFFLLCVGLPILVMEFSVGRAARQNMGLAFRTLEPRGTKWHLVGPFSLIGSYFLMMFYAPVAGWMLAYFYYTASGAMTGLNPEQIGAVFGGLLASPTSMFMWTVLTLAIGFGVCAMGVRGGVERVVKYMMLGLFFILIALAYNSLSLPGAEAGLAFYLAPNWDNVMKTGFWPMLNAAMGQAFFTLSIGIGSMTIFGSYLNRDRTLTGEAGMIMGLDTVVALLSGLIIFPACSAFGVSADAGPSLIFITLPNVFNNMSAGQLWGALFFIFMACAALSTVIAVLENVVSYSIDVWGWTRKKAVCVNGVVLLMLTLPCILGFNLLSNITPFGAGSTVLDLEDFIVSNNLLPLGSLVFLLFCCKKNGWGWDNFIKEADSGQGPKFPAWLRPYLTYVLPFIVLFVLLQGYLQKFAL